MHLGPQGDAQKTWRASHAKKKNIVGDAGVMFAFLRSSLASVLHKLGYAYIVPRRIAQHLSYWWGIQTIAFWSSPPLEQ